jgi:hypothetical protein
MRTITIRVTAAAEQQHELERWVRAQGTPQAVVRRARIVLATLGGMTSKGIGRQLRISHPPSANGRGVLPRAGWKV